MTAPDSRDSVVLLPCPFCGSEAERIDFGPGSGDNEGGSCIACTKCQASGPVEFGYKENFVANWNRRDLARGPQQAGGEDAKARNEAAALDSALNAVQELQAEVARLRESLSGSRNVLDLLRSVVSAEGVSKFTHVESRSGSLVCVQSTINAIDAALNGGQDDA